MMAADRRRAPAVAAGILGLLTLLVGIAGAAEKPPPDSDWRLHRLSRCAPHAPVFPDSRAAMEEALELVRLDNGGDAMAVLEAALAEEGARPWLRLLLAQLYVLAGQGEPHCRPLEGPAAATGDWPRDRMRWLQRADELLVSLTAIWPDDSLVDFLRADAARAAGDPEAAAEHDFRGRGKCSYRQSLQLVQSLRDLRPRPPQVLEPIVPEYPSECARRGIEGLVVLDLLIDPQGRAVEVVVIGRADRRLAAAAREAAAGGGYQAAQLGYYPVWSWLRVPVQFTLEN
jgi:TonB family protein